MKIALVYDRVNKIGGAERVLQVLHRMYPDAPLYTAVYDKQRAPWAKSFDVRPSFLQCIPFAARNHEYLAPLTPFAFEQFSFDVYDVVISVTSADAKAVITKPQTLHVCYCLTPTRYLWSHTDQYFHQKGFQLISRPVRVHLRAWDRVAATRADAFIAISHTVARRVRKYYNRPAPVIYPPVDTKFFTPHQFSSKIGAGFTPNEYYLVVSRLVRYKAIDIVIDAFNQSGKKLIIIGDGRDRRRLQRRARNNIEFAGAVDDQTLRRHYQNCRAVIFPQEEDFGIVAVEAQSCGKPVIALRRGGATEIVQEGETGEFFDVSSAHALNDAVARGEHIAYSQEKCRRNAERFADTQFVKAYGAQMTKLWNAHKKLYLL